MRFYKASKSKGRTAAIGKEQGQIVLNAGGRAILAEIYELAAPGHEV